MTELDHLLAAFERAIESGHGYLPARRGVVAHVDGISADLETERRKVKHYTALVNSMAVDLADRNRTIAQYRERHAAAIETDELPDGERLA